MALEETLTRSLESAIASSDWAPRAWLQKMAIVNGEFSCRIILNFSTFHLTCYSVVRIFSNFVDLSNLILPEDLWMVMSERIMTDIKQNVSSAKLRRMPWIRFNCE